MNRIYLYIFVSIITLCLPSIMLAKQVDIAEAIINDAFPCVSLSSHTNPVTKQKAHKLMNKCNEQIIVFWCIPSQDNKVQQKRCGGNRYYKGSKLLQPNESSDNYYNHPYKFPVHYGACLGKRKNVIPTKTQSYKCGNYD